LTNQEKQLLLLVGQLILIKMMKFVATKCHILIAKMHQIRGLTGCTELDHSIIHHSSFISLLQQMSNAFAVTYD